ncbi:ribosome biogenesis GTPase YlqF [Vallitalea okinawensis]|uniref:ribosome biogenesis GTPase YlqF n=1 Tax=Vallitalea okinawensis TaxID=2078660 RepID=UPI000CFB76DA|nr:ribosome biogenesis GTPase YlqF [Vallitalea okinawensis]
MNIQWYPGHMTKAKRMMQENLKLVDIVIELVDARIPFSSKNPDMNELSKNKQRVIAINKCDLGDDKVIKQWVQWYKEQGYGVVCINSINGKGLGRLLELSRELCKEKIERDKKRGRIFRPIRAMVVGIPNVGKSTFINKLVGKASAKTGNKPGVTKGKQWIKLKKDVELLDTPGILWPKFEDKNIALKVAYIGSIKDEILDTYTLSTNLAEYLREHYPSAIENRYAIDDISHLDGPHIIEEIADKRGFKKAGNELDIERAANLLVDEFRNSRLGRFTLEVPTDLEEANLS